jgi:hypothetical protein
MISICSFCARWDADQESLSPLHPLYRLAAKMPLQSPGGSLAASEAFPRGLEGFDLKAHRSHHVRAKVAAFLIEQTFSEDLQYDDRS